MSSDRSDKPTDIVPPRARQDLFLISVLILFLELACIRWFPAHVLFLTFFTNTVLLACFLGMSLGCLAVNHPRNYIASTPYVLGVALAAALTVEMSRNLLELDARIDVGNQSAPQFVYFGTEYAAGDVAKTRIPVEVFGAGFFLLIALIFVGPGQELGRALQRLPNRVEAYTINICGSLVGIALLAGCSWLELPPFWWFLPAAVGLGYFLLRSDGTAQPRVAWVPLTTLLLALVLVSVTSGSRSRDGKMVVDHYWSPYYRIDYLPQDLFISTNQIGHQLMIPNQSKAPSFAYPLPYLLQRDSRQVLGQAAKPFLDVLIIGAGSGNDVGRALQWGAAHIDAVEIDPLIQRLGARYHPDRPYDDPRVRVHLDDGRNFLRSSPSQRYDLIVYALVDSLVLQSGYSNIRLESYLFTRQAFEDVRRCLKPDGLFVMYNLFRQPWIVKRLHETLEAVFGQDDPLVMCLPSRREVSVSDEMRQDFTAIFAGDTGPLKQAFQKHPTYLLASGVSPSPHTENGFLVKLDGPITKDWAAFFPARFSGFAAPVGMATDDWPFLYLRTPMIPDHSLRGAAIMGGLALALLFIFLRGTTGANPVPADRHWSLPASMFFLGAGFMLIETKAVVHMALLFGSTWMVNSVVFFAILLMILAANLYVLKVKPENLLPYYLGLLLTLLANVALPLDFFLGMNRFAQVAGSCTLVFAPVVFAGVIFAVQFRRSQEPDRAFGANIAGAMVGGLAEYSSMLLGFQYLGLLALAFYALSLVGLKSAPAPKSVPETVPQPA
jgi:SAM-dependent methyltransferase